MPDGWDRLQRAVRRHAQPISNHLYHPTVRQVLIEAETAVCVGVASRVELVDLVDGKLVMRGAMVVRR